MSTAATEMAAAAAPEMAAAAAAAMAATATARRGEFSSKEYYRAKRDACRDNFENLGCHSAGSRGCSFFLEGRMYVDASVILIKT